MQFIQWTTPDNETFFPAGQVVCDLPPGYYTVDTSYNGIFFKKKQIKNEGLLRFPDSSSDAVINEISRFWGLRDRFVESSISHKRGILLYGPPGSGKTSTLRVVVEDLVNNHKGIVLEWCGSELFLSGYNIIRGIHPELPIIVMMEDVDALFEGYNGSSTLNILDGVHKIDRILFLATTNHPEKLGSRIINRPSRFDKRFLIGMPNAESRKMYLESKGIKDNELKQWVEDTDGLSIAHLKELYVANKILGDDYSQAISTIKEMRFVPSSKFFDDTVPMSERQAKKYENYGDGKTYAEARVGKRGRTIMERNQKSPNDIALLMD